MTRVPRVQRHARHGAERGGLNNITAVYWWPVPDGVGSPTFDCEAIAGTFTREYCEIDRFEACAVDAQCPIGDGASDCDPDAQHALIDFAKCFECDDGCDDPAHAAPCAADAGLDADAIQACADGGGAVPIMNIVHGFANNSDPIVTGFPDIRVDYKVQANSFPSSVRELEAAICDAYTGP